MYVRGEVKFKFVLEQIWQNLRPLQHTTWTYLLTSVPAKLIKLPMDKGFSHRFPF